MTSRVRERIGVVVVLAVAAAVVLIGMGSTGASTGASTVEPPAAASADPLLRTGIAPPLGAARVNDGAEGRCELTVSDPIVLDGTVAATTSLSCNRPVASVEIVNEFVPHGPDGNVGGAYLWAQEAGRYTLTDTGRTTVPISMTCADLRGRLAATGVGSVRDDAVSTAAGFSVVWEAGGSPTNGGLPTDSLQTAFSGPTPLTC